LTHAIASLRVALEALPCFDHNHPRFEECYISVEACIWVSKVLVDERLEEIAKVSRQVHKPK